MSKNKTLFKANRDNRPERFTTQSCARGGETYNWTKRIERTPPCHLGTIPIVKFVNKNNKTIGIFGGGWSRAVSVGNIQVIIDLSGGYKSVISANEKAKVLFPKFYVPFKGAIIRIEWQDFESCPLTYDYWFGLAEDIQNLKEDTNILFACYGGHGRTGTAICALLFALQLVEGDVIKFVRQVYCEKAVESKAQLGYLINMGITTEERTKLFFDHGFERTSFGNGD